MSGSESVEGRSDIPSRLVDVRELARILNAGLSAL